MRLKQEEESPPLTGLSSLGWAHSGWGSVASLCHSTPSEHPTLLEVDVKNQRRTLDKYPMHISKEETSRRMSAKRSARVAATTTAQKARNNSSSLSQYSKSLFDDAVTRTAEKRSESALPRLDGERPATRPPSYASFHSGPTQFGSPIYNNQLKMLNAMRMRTNSESVSANSPRYDHERSKTSCAPDIQQFLQKSNSTFRVITPGGATWPGSNISVNLSNCPSSSGAEYRDLILVPTQTIPEDTEDMDLLLTHEREGTGPAYPVAPTHHPRGFSRHSGSAGSRKHSQNGSLKLQSATRGVMLNDGLEVQKAESILIEDDKEVIPTKEVVIEQAPVTQKPAAVEAVKNQTKTQQNVVRAEKKPAKGKLNNANEKVDSLTESDASSNWKDKLETWVDDVTVSSVPRTEKSGGSNDQVAPINSPRAGKGRASRAPDKTKPTSNSKVVIETKPEDADEAVDIAADAKEQNKLAKVLSLHELQESSMTLPDFICPSSEDKSKQARIKQWLQNTAFTVASRSVPLL